MEYAGKSQRSNDLFQNKDSMAKAKKYFNSYVLSKLIMKK